MIGADAESWLFTSWSTMGWIMLSGLLMLLIVVGFIRLTGLRSLAKMSTFDFAVTVAIGSILGSVVASDSSIADGALAIGSLLAVQWAISQFRRRSFGSQLVDNTPMLLVRDGEFIEEALTKARVTRSDVYAKLRQSNVHRMDEVIAVVLETTGDISVIHGEGPLDAALYDNVRQFRTDGPLTPEPG
ncbi:MAG TPA: YetF domain-containing protein [Ilumatobacteraceae bacterium]|nr:YetF domain-containing protein [Ilumatobacteraceae bacterium]